MSFYSKHFAFSYLTLKKMISKHIPFWLTVLLAMIFPFELQTLYFVKLIPLLDLMTGLKCFISFFRIESIDLDGDESPEPIYTYTIRATDSGQPSLAETTTVYINIHRVNEHTPTFTVPSLSFSVAEDFPLNTPVATVGMELFTIFSDSDDSFQIPTFNRLVVSIVFGQLNDISFVQYLIGNSQ